MATVDLCQAEPLEPLGDLLERLEAIEARLQASGPRPTPVQRATTGEVRATSPGAAPPARAAPIPTVSATVAAPVTPTATTPLTPPVTPPASQTATRNSSSMSDPAEAWRRVKSDLEKRRPRIGALLANAHVLEIDGSKLVLGFDDRADVDATERVRGEIEQALSAELSAPVRLIARQDKGGSAAPPLIRAENREEADALSADKFKREQEARQHPIIQKAQDLFGVAIREIKT